MFRDGLFVVGPESVGAFPGPVAYGKQGGRAPSALMPAITDANVVLGRIVPDAFPKVCVCMCVCVCLCVCVSSLATCHHAVLVLLCDEECNTFECLPKQVL